MTIDEPQPPPQQVLLLEKDPGLAHVLGLMLRQTGCRVKPCAAVSEMLTQLIPTRLLAEGIDLVLADLAGSGPDQEKLLTRLRTAAALLPVIVIAPYGQEQQRAGLGNQPGCHFLTSPLDPEELRRCLALATARCQAISHGKSAITANSKGETSCTSRN